MRRRGATDWDRFIAREALPAGFEAVAASRKGVEVPEIGEDEASPERHRVLEAVFEKAEPGSLERSRARELVHGAIAGARRDDRHGGRAAVERVLDRPERPCARLGGGNPGQSGEHEDAQGDGFVGEEVGSAAEQVERHPLVEAGQNLGMHRLEAHGHFEPPRDPVAEGPHRGAHERGVRFHDDSLERGDELGDRGMILGRHRAAVEEAPGVVELDSAGGREDAQRLADLLGDRARRHGLLERVLPEIAHQALPGTLPVGQEDRGHRDGARPAAGFRRPPLRRAPRRRGADRGDFSADGVPGSSGRGRDRPPDTESSPPDHA